MKTFLGLIVLVALGCAFYVWQNNKSDLPEIKITPTTTHPDVANATYIFEDETIALKGGRFESENYTETEVTDDVAYGDINGDGNNDAAAIFVQSGGGSGTFIYLASLVSGNVTYKGSNAVFLGDRVSPEAISIDSGGVITVSYLDRKPDEPMAAEPTVSVTKKFIYRNGKLEER